jgi:hypothetical protein
MSKRVFRRGDRVITLKEMPLGEHKIPEGTEGLVESFGFYGGLLVKLEYREVERSVYFSRHELYNATTKNLTFDDVGILLIICVIGLVVLYNRL